MTQRRRAAVVGLALAALVSPGAAAAAEPADAAPFAVGTEFGLFGESRNDGLQGERGLWELLVGRLGADELRLTFRIELPPVALPVESGPAVLFGGLRLFGDAGGDMATGEAVRGLASAVLPPCREVRCRYETAIGLPIADLDAALRRLEGHGTLMWASAELTLVRTFAGGTWLQVLPFQFGGRGALEANAGTLGAIRPTGGPIFPFGLFPADEATPVPDDGFAFPGGLDYAAIVENARRAAGDASRPIAVVPAVLHAGVRPACDGSPALTIHDRGGDWVFATPLHLKRVVDAQLALPAGVDWWLALHDGGGIDFDQRQGWGVRLGPFGVRDEPVAIDAELDCRTPAGVLRIEPTAPPAQAPARSPAPSGLDTSPSVGVGPPDSVRPAFVAIAVVAVVVLLFELTRRRHVRS